MKTDNKYEELESRIINAAANIPIGDSQIGWRELSKGLSKPNTKNTGHWSTLGTISRMTLIIIFVSIGIGITFVCLFFNKSSNNQDLNNTGFEHMVPVSIPGKTVSNKIFQSNKSRLLPLKNQKSINETIEAEVITPLKDESSKKDSVSENAPFIIW